MPKTPTLLYVDDQEENLKAFKRVFKNDFNIFTALNGEEGLDLFEEHPEITLLVSDQRMPGMSGVDFLNACKHINPLPIRIIITGYADLESTINAINEAEIYRFVAKPWQSHDLRQTLLEAQKKYDLITELELKNKKLESLDRLKTQFMMLVNHELKTPITVQRSYIELLKDLSPNEEALGFIEKSIKGSERMEDLVNEILYFLKIQSEENVEMNDNMNLGEVLKVKQIDYKIKSNKSYFSDAINRLIKNANDHKAENTEIEIFINKNQLSIVNEMKKNLKPPDLDIILKPFEINEEAFNHSKGLGMGLSIATLILNKLGHKVEINVHEKFEVRIDLSK